MVDDRCELGWVGVHFGTIRVLSVFEGKMETSSGSNSRYGIHIAASNFIQAPLAALLEYSGFLISTRSSSSQETDGLIAPSTASLDTFQSRPEDRDSDRDHDLSSPASTREEVSIRIIGAGEQEREPISLDNDRSSSEQISEAPPLSATSRNESATGVAAVNSGGPTADGEPANGGGVSNRDSSYQRYDIQQFARWIEQILPFSLLLLVVFIRQHLQGTSPSSILCFFPLKPSSLCVTNCQSKKGNKFMMYVCVFV